MTREFEVDPEVIADLKLRAATEHDRSRSRPTSYAWTPPKIVGAWHCKNPRCRVLVDVTEETMERFCMFNAHLRRRGEDPLEPSKILYCDSCIVEYKRTAPDRRRGQMDRVAVAIRQLKESGDSSRERDLIAQLEEWGHPDVTGLVQAITERRAAASGTGTRRKSL